MNAYQLVENETRRRRKMTMKAANAQERTRKTKKMHKSEFSCKDENSARDSEH